MEVELIELSQTLATGAFICLGFLLFIRTLDRLAPKKTSANPELALFEIEKWLFTPFWKLSDKSHLLSGIFVFASFFLAGSIIDNYAKNLLAHRDRNHEEDWQKALRVIGEGALIEDDDMIFTTYFKDTDVKSIMIPGVILTESCDLILSRGAPQFFYSKVSRLDQTIDAFNNHPDQKGQESVVKASKQLYYYAKNVAYTNENFYDELMMIHFRMTYLRSCAFISIVLFWFYEILSVFLLIIGIFMVSWTKIKKVRYSLSPAIILLLLHLFSSFVYRAESIGFYLRVLGYCNTIVSLMKNS